MRPHNMARFSTHAGYVCASQAQAKLQQLASLGVGYRRAAELAGIAWLTAYRIRAGLTTVIHPETESAILGIRPSLARGCYVSAYDGKRLLLSLLGEDYAPEHIAQRLRVHPATVERLERGQGRRMRVETALRLRAFWQQAST